MTVRVKIEGLSAVKDALHDLPKATAKNVMRRVLKTRAEPIAEDARRRVPVDEGQLRDSIAVSTKLSRRQRRTHKKASRDQVDMFVGAGPLPQAHLQEFGTWSQPAQPFLRPAWAKHKSSIIEDIRQDLWAEIQKAVERRERKLAKARAQ